MDGPAEMIHGHAVTPSPLPRRDRVLELIRRHGWNATSFQVLEEGFAYWLDPVADACVAYVDTGGAWVAAGAPIAAAADIAGAARRFVAAAQHARRRACFFAVETRFEDLTGLSTMAIGAQPMWTPSWWSEVVAGSRSLREQLRRARAKGVTVRIASADEMRDPASGARAGAERLIDRWLASRRMAPMGFLVDVQPFALPEERCYLVAERAGVVIGVLVGVPIYARRGWLFEDLLRDPDAPNGTIELLVDAGMREAAARDADLVTLGLAPLAGDLPRWLRVVRSASSALYDFDGLRRFKQKLQPDTWLPIFLAWGDGSSGNRALVDALAAFTMRGGHGPARASFTRFGVETVLRSPAFAVRLLGAALVPWTIGLALADSARWFPTPAVQLGWIAFDVVLAIAMLSLAHRWRPALAWAVTGAVTADAVVTLLEAAVFNVPHVRGFGEHLVLIIACAGPLLAATLLWTVLLRQRAR